MEYLSFLVSPIVGAIIGYFTNWLAIKMLFKPHAEKYLLGVKLPFTPGLIPKERYRLANKVGESIGQHILNKDVLYQALASEQNVEKIDKMYDNIFQSVKEYSLYDIFTKLEIDIKDKHIQKLLIPILYNQALSLLKCNVQTVFTPERIDLAHQFLMSKTDLLENIEDTILDAAMKKMDTLLKSDKKIRDLLPPSAPEQLKTLLDEHFDDCAQFLAGILGDETVSVKLRKLVNNIVNENVGILSSFFVNGDKIYDSIIKNVKEYILERENQLEMIGAIYQKLESIGQYSVSDALQKLPDHFLDNINIPYYVANNFSASSILSKTANALKDFAAQTHFNLHDLLMTFEPHFDEKLRQWMDENLPRILSLWKNKQFSLFNKPVKDFLHNAQYEKAKNYCTKKTMDAIVQYSPYFLSQIQIDKIAEEQINKFEIAYAEEIILQVIKRELNAITIAGGVLGFIIGFVPVIMQLLAF